MSDYNLMSINGTAGSWRRYALYGITSYVFIENTPNRGTPVKSLPCRKFRNNASTSSFAKWLSPFFPPQHVKTPQRCATREQNWHHCGWQKRMNVICSHTDCLLHILLSAVWHFFFFFCIKGLWDICCLVPFWRSPQSSYSGGRPCLWCSPLLPMAPRWPVTMTELLFALFIAFATVCITHVGLEHDEMDAQRTKSCRWFRLWFNTCTWVWSALERSGKASAFIIALF